MKKNTDDLRQELTESADLGRFLQENQSEFLSETVAHQLSELCRNYGISKAALTKQACISEVYLHQIFAGRRTPSRNRLLCICYGLGASLEETQALLRCCSYAPLYPKDRRDAIIQHGLLHGTGLMEINRTLETQGLETLY